MRRSCWIEAGVGVLAALAAGPVFAAPVQRAASTAGLDVPVSFNIPPQSLDLALLLYSRQSQIQVISAASSLANKTAAGFRGVGTPRAALAQILRGTGLRFVPRGAGTVAVVVDAAEAAPFEGGRPRAERSRTIAPAPGSGLQGEPEPPGLLEEVVVTATRQVSTQNQAPLSLSALTQRAFDQQGLKSIADLQLAVPALAVTNTLAGLQTFTIRGVLTTQGAATTGIYLDDTSLTKRNVSGPAATTTANGTPAPPLFDLDRVEVLRGPQGTLYGGSSEGGRSGSSPLRPA